LFDQNYSQFEVLLKPVLYKKKDEFSPKLKSFIQNKLNVAISKEHRFFYHRTSNTGNNTSVNFGITISLAINQEKDDIKVKMNMEKQLYLTGMQYF
jgi:hypothetical protein